MLQLLLLLQLPSAAVGLRLSPAKMVATQPAATIAAERYVATNRFRVKDGREAAFEKRWADRKSRLGLLDGFRFFCMLRRLPADEGKPAPADDINYISCTVWENFDAFDAWKTGDAFKEAHGGGTIGGIADMLVATAMNTKGKPKAAMWEGVLPVSMPPASASDTPVAWRDVSADGKSMLDGECFVAMNRFSVAEGMSDAFEQLSEEHREMLTQTAQPAHTRQPEKKKTEAFFIGDRNKDEAESDDEFEEDMEEDVMDRAALKKQSIGIVDKGTKKRKPRRRRAKSDD